MNNKKQSVQPVSSLAPMDFLSTQKAHYYRLCSTTQVCMSIQDPAILFLVLSNAEEPHWIIHNMLKQSLS